jgi:hypothetical protein
VNEPRRWLEDSAVPRELSELLRNAKGAEGSRPMPAAAQARSALRLQQTLAFPAAAGRLLWLKGAATAGVVVVSLAVAHAILARSRHESVPVPAETITAATAADPAPSTEEPTPAAAAVEAISPAAEESGGGVEAPTPVLRPSRTETAPTAEVDSLAREAEMLHRARSLLDSDPKSALALLDAHASQYPSGHLALEREFIAVDALRRLQRISQARSRAQSLLRRASGTLYEERVRAILENLPPR